MHDMKVDINLLRRLRDDRAWSQEHLAAVAGLSVRTIQRIENEGRASHESRLALASAFGIDPVELVLSDTGGTADVGRDCDAAASSMPEWLNLSSRELGALLTLAAVFASVVFIYQAGHAAGEFWYYLVH